MSWNVLVLDDNPKSAAEIQRGLSDVGCNVHVITDKRLLAGAKSFSRITRDQFDVVLVSVAMPRLAGLNLFDRIHRETHRRSIPVVLIGSDVSALARHEAGATPAEGYIRRPPEHDALVVELGAGLLAVVGGGTRTVPPPANTEEVQARRSSCGRSSSSRRRATSSRSIVRFITRRWRLPRPSSKSDSAKSGRWANPR